MDQTSKIYLILFLKEYSSKNWILTMSRTICKNWKLINNLVLNTFQSMLCVYAKINSMYLKYDTKIFKKYEEINLHKYRKVNVNSHQSRGTKTNTRQLSYFIPMAAVEISGRSDLWQTWRSLADVIFGRSGDLWQKWSLAVLEISDRSGEGQTRWSQRE